jgi:hypothetical protein
MYSRGVSRSCSRSLRCCFLIQDHLDADLGHTTIRNPQAARGAEREVEDAVANPWSAVGDHNHYRSVGCKISNANSRAERQAAVRCSWQIPIER